MENVLTSLPKRIVLGRPISSNRMEETTLPKRLALPVFCSDPLSSNAYATEEILLVLSIGGLAFLHLAPWVALAVVALLVIVVLSYRQTCHAYPNGGGAYAVSRDNLGRRRLAGRGERAARRLRADRRGLGRGRRREHRLGLPHARAARRGHRRWAGRRSWRVMNLRGVKESGTVFAIPTYGFIVVRVRDDRRRARCGAAR